MSFSKNQYFIIFIFVVALVSSIAGLRDASLDILPEFQAKTIEVQTEALGLSASEVEDFVTVNIEEMLTNTPWMQKMESTSVNGLSSVKLTFAPDTDIMEARQMVAENLTLSRLIPNVSQESVIIQPKSTTNRVMAVGLSSEDLSLIDISQLSRWNIRPALMSVPGVSNVSIWGHRERQLQVQIDQEKIKNTVVSLDDVIKNTGNAFWMSDLTHLEASTPGSGGWIDTPNQRLEIQHILPIRNEEDLSQISFSNANYLNLGDVANVVEGHQPLIGDSVLGEVGGILLVIEKYPWSGVLDVTSGVEDKLKELKVGLSGIDVDTTIFRPATFIESAVSNLGYVFLISFILLLIGFVILFNNLRAVLLTSFSVLASFVIVFYILHLFGFTLNTILFTGTVASFGIMVDQIINGFKKNSDESIQMTLITVLLIVPIFFLDNNFEALYESLVFSYVISILVGMFFALFVFPTIVKYLSSDIDIRKMNFLFVERIKNTLVNVLRKSIKSPSSNYVVVVIILAIGSISLLFFAKSSILPDYNERTFVVELENIPGTSLPEMNRVVGNIKDKVKAIEGVNNFGAHIGRSIMGDQVTGVNSAQLWISIDEDVDYENTKNNITESLYDYSDIVKNIGTYSQETMNKHLTYNNESLFVRVYGPDFDELQDQAQEVKEDISRVTGVISPEIITESHIQVPGIKIEVKTDIASRYGLKPGDIRRSVATLVNGLQVANRFEEQKVYQVAVWSLPEERRNIKDIENLLIDTSYGGRVALSDVADISIVPISNKIEREAMSRYVDVIFESRGDESVISEELKKTLHNMELSLEYHTAVLGGNTEKSISFPLVLFIIIAGVFLLLQSIFNSWRLAVLILITGLATLSGSVLIAYLLGDNILLASVLLGIIVVFSMSIRNIVVLISHYKKLESVGLIGETLVLNGTKDLIMSILVKTIAAIVFFIPVLFVGNVPGLELIRPMAIIIVSGLITSTLLIIFVLPKLYLWICNKNIYE